MHKLSLFGGMQTRTHVFRSPGLTCRTDVREVKYFALFEHLRFEISACVCFLIYIKSSSGGIALEMNHKVSLNAIDILFFPTCFPTCPFLFFPTYNNLNNHLC